MNKRKFSTRKSDCLILAVLFLLFGVAFAQQSKNASDTMNGESFAEQKASAEKGDAHAQLKLGISYYFGDGVAQDHVEAAKWLNKAAEQGDADAQVMLGYFYYLGHGATKDYGQAYKWFRKAAEQGNATAQDKLGVCYYAGDGVAKNYVEAVKWFRKAAEQGNATAQSNLGGCYHTGEGVAKDDGEAVKWLKKSCRTRQRNRAIYAWSLLLCLVSKIYGQIHWVQAGVLSCDTRRFP